MVQQSMSEAALVIRLIDRYVLREIRVPFALGGALFTFFLIIDRIYSLTDLVITKGVPFHLVLQLLVYMLPSFLAHTLPMALLVTILLAGGRLAADLEIVAFSAAGVSPVRLLRPVLAAAVVVALATASLTTVVIPAANTAFQYQLFRILQSRAASGLKERIFNTTFGDTVIYIEEVSASQVALKGLLVSDERDPKTTKIITAREGRLLTDEENRRITLRLIDGGINESDVVLALAVRPVVTPPPAAAPAPAPVESATTSARYRYTAFGIYDMTLSLGSPFKDAAKLEKPERNLSMRGLARTIDDITRKGDAATPYRVEYEKRLALPFVAIVFALIGFPLAVGSHRGGRSLALVGSLAILVSYYLLLSSLESLTLSGRLPVRLGIWLPNLLFAAAGLGLMWARARGARRRRFRWLTDGLDRAWGYLSRVRPGSAADQGPRPPRESTHLIDRYLVRSYLGFFAIGLAVASVLFVIVDLLQTLDRYLRVKPPLLYILEHFVYRLPAGVYAGLPVVTLVATIFLFLTISRFHELTALKAAGVSLYRVSLPVLGLAVVTAIGAGLFQEFALPTLNERGDELDRVRIRGQQPRHLQVRTRIWLRSSETRFYRLELLDPVARDLHGLTILEIDRNFRLLNRLDAALAHWTPEGWELSEGALREIGPYGDVQTVPFRVTALDLPEQLDDFTEIQKPVDAMSFVELKAYVTRLQETGHRVTKYLVELYSKLSAPLAHLVMALVGIPFAIQSPRGGRLVGIGLAIGILIGYLVVHYSAIAFAKADLLPPLLAAWTANIVFLGIGAAMLARART
jgi:lipopolysaccharide export system permease protein